MKNLKRIIYALLLTLSFTLFVNAQTDWLGEYEFDEDGGKTAGGSKIYIAHTLHISSYPKNTYKLVLKSQGFQTSIDILAIGKPVGNKLNVYYTSKREDHSTGEYQKDDLLFTFEKKEIDGKTKILTYWEKFQPILEQNEKSGEIYFEKFNSSSKTKVNDDKWIRITTKNKGLSLAFPADSLVNNEKTKTVTNQIFGYKNGVAMSLKVWGKQFNKSTLKRSITIGVKNRQDFKVGRYIISQTTTVPGAENYTQSYVIVSKNEYYTIAVTAKSADDQTVALFLKSMKLEGKPLFKQTSEDFTERTISVEKMKTSTEIFDALNRKTSKMKRKITYDIQIGGSEEINDSRNFSRPAIIVLQPRAKLSNIFKKGYTALDVSIRLELLASGQVGDITVVKADSEKLAKTCCVNVVKDVKFVPAQIDGKNVDSTYIIKFNYRVFTRTITRTVIR